MVERNLNNEESSKTYLSCHTLNNTEKVMGYAGLDLFTRFRSIMLSALQQHGGLKVYPTARCVMVKMLEGEVIDQDDNYYVSAKITAINSAAALDTALQEMISSMKQRITELPTKGSGWVFQRVSTLQIHLAKYKPLKGSSYFELPKPLMLKKAVVNVKNDDQQCFKWAVLSALFPAGKNAERVKKYAEHESKLNWEGLTFPVTLQQIPKFEQRNNIRINVYGWDKKDKPYMLQKSKIHDTEQHVDLLLQC